jgi:hypothetical protein
VSSHGLPLIGRLCLWTCISVSSYIFHFSMIFLFNFLWYIFLCITTLGLAWFLFFLFLFWFLYIYMVIYDTDGHSPSQFVWYFMISFYVPSLVLYMIRACWLACMISLATLLRRDFLTPISTRLPITDGCHVMIDVLFSHTDYSDCAYSYTFTQQRPSLTVHSTLLTVCSKISLCHWTMPISTNSI